MLEFIREAPGQRTALAALAERAFLQNGASVHFASLLPKLYGQEACAQPVHTLLLENGTPAGLFALQVSEFQIAGMPLRVGWIGTVCVLPEFRGRGHLAHLMEEADRQLHAQGCALAVLGGQRQRYRRFGYELGGTQWQFTVTARNLRGLPEPEDASVRPLCEADIPQAFRLWKTQPVLGPRTPQTFLWILQSWGCEPLGVWDGGQLAGYASCNAQGAAASAGVSCPVHGAHGDARAVAGRAAACAGRVCGAQRLNGKSQLPSAALGTGHPGRAGAGSAVRASARHLPPADRGRRDAGASIWQLPLPGRPQYTGDLPDTGRPASVRTSQPARAARSGAVAPAAVHAAVAGRHLSTP